MVGIDDTAASNPPQLSYGGVFNVSGSSVTGGTIDVNSAGGMHSETINPMNSTISTPDANGRGTIVSVGISPNPTRTFIYYVVTPKVLRLTESDGAAFMGGTAYAQGNASTTLSGSYVYQHSGWNPALATPPTGRTVGAGQFSVASGSTSLSGFSDANTTNPGDTPATTGSAGVAVTGSYTVSSTESATINLTLSDAAGSSTYNMYMVDPTLNLLDPNNTTGGGGAVLLHTGTLVNGTGIAIPQQTAGTLVGNYALNLNNSIANASSSTPSELDLVGVVSGDGNAHFGGAARLGLADYDEVTPLDSPPAIVGAPLSGGFQIDQGHAGRATGTFTVGVPAGWPTPYPFIPGAATPVTLSVAIYQVSSTESFIVETDTQANVSGYLVQQQLP
jgi:hypothetical protein